MTWNDVRFFFNWRKWRKKTIARHANTRLLFLDASLTAGMGTFGGVVFDRPIIALSPANLIAILSGLEKLHPEAKAKFNEWRYSSMKTKIL
jgi:hypothetical protein